MGQKVVDKIEFIIQLCKGKRVIDLGFLNHSATSLAVSSLHKELYSSAAEVVGVDIEAEEIEKVRNGLLKGYKTHLFAFDVTKDLPASLLSEYNKPFDVVLACDLIEHLDNPAGLFANCHKLLKEDGILILTTANPFYIDLWLYIWLKNSVNVNPQHVSWICPETMREMVGRNGFYIDSSYWLKGSWNLGRFILQRKGCYYSHRQARWVGSSFTDKAIGFGLGLFWRPSRWLLTILSPINRHSDYMVICHKRGMKNERK